MTLDRTLPPPKTKPWHKCSVEGCPNLWQVYHGKVGCMCHACDNKTPDYRKPENIDEYQQTNSRTPSNPTGEESELCRATKFLKSNAVSGEGSALPFTNLGVWPTEREQREAGEEPILLHPVDVHPGEPEFADASDRIQKRLMQHFADNAYKIQERLYKATLATAMFNISLSSAVDQLIELNWEFEKLCEKLNKPVKPVGFHIIGFDEADTFVSGALPRPVFRPFNFKCDVNHKVKGSHPQPFYRKGRW